MNKLIALTVLAVLPAFAQQELPGTEERPQPPSREGFHKKMLEKYDADKDGKLSDEEKAAMEADMEQHRGKRGPRGPHGPEGDHPANPACRASSWSSMMLIKTANSMKKSVRLPERP